MRGKRIHMYRMSSNQELQIGMYGTTTVSDSQAKTSCEIRFRCVPLCIFSIDERSKREEV